MKPERRPSFQDQITCLECFGSPITTKSNPRIVSNDKEGCGVCEGKGYLPRNLAYAYYIGSHGDDILYRSKKPGDTAKAYNIVSESLALMSFFPGGVSLGDLHFEAAFKDYFRRIRKVVPLEHFIRRLRKIEAC